MTYRAPYGAAALWAITVIAAIGSVVLLAMSWHRTLTDDLWTGFGGLSFAMLSVAFSPSAEMVARPAHAAAAISAVEISSRARRL